MYYLRLGICHAHLIVISLIVAHTPIISCIILRCNVVTLMLHAYITQTTNISRSYKSEPYSYTSYSFYRGCNGITSINILYFRSFENT